MKKILITLIASLMLFPVLGQNHIFPHNDEFSYDYGNFIYDFNHNLILTVYDNWKNEFYKDSVSYSCVTINADGDITSESISIGMLIMAYIPTNARMQQDFRKLYNFYSKNKNANGLMYSHIAHGTIKNKNSDTGADLDIALALIMAHEQWGSTAEYNYIEEAQKLLDSIYKYEIEDNLLKASDKASEKYKTNIHALANLRLFHNVQSMYPAIFENSQHNNWLDVYNTSLKYLHHASSHSTAGLFPNCTSADLFANPEPQENTFGEDAHKLLWRLAINHAWFGDETTKHMLTRIANYTQNQSSSTIMGPLNLKGNPTGEDHTASLIGALTCSFMVDSYYRDKLTSWYNELTTFAYTKLQFKNTSYRLLSMLLATGSMPNFTKMGAESFYVMNAENDPRNPMDITVTFSNTIAASSIIQTSFTIVSENGQELTSAKSADIIIGKSNKIKIKCNSRTDSLPQPIFLKYTGNTVKDNFGNVLKKDSILINVKKSDGYMLSDFESSNISCRGDRWYTFDDAEIGGLSTVLPAPKTLFTTNEDGANATTYSACLQFNLTTQSINNPHVGMSANIKGIEKLMANANVQGISFWHKGSGITVQITSENSNTNKTVHYKKIPYGEYWTYYNISLNEFHQNVWDKPATLDPLYIKTINWVVENSNIASNYKKTWIDQISIIGLPDLPNLYRELAFIDSIRTTTDTINIGAGHKQYSTDIKALIDANLSQINTLFNNAADITDRDSLIQSITTLRKHMNSLLFSQQIVNFTQLKANVDEATMHLNNADEGLGHLQFTTSAIQKLQEATQKAIMLINKIGVLQESVTKQADSLQTEIEDFKNSQIHVDFSNIRELLNISDELIKNTETGNGHNLYSAELKNSLLALMDKATKLLEVTGILASKIKETEDELSVMYNRYAQSKMIVNFTMLKSTIQDLEEEIKNKSYGNGHKQFPTGSDKIITTAINYAEQIIEITGISDKNVSDTIQYLHNAKTLFLSQQILIDFTALQDSVAKATAITDTIKTGNGHLQYDSEIKQNLIAQIANATALMNDGVLEDTIATATDTIAQLIQQLLSSKKNIDFGKLQDTIDIYTYFANTIDIGYANNQYPPQSVSLFKNQIQKAKSYINAIGTTDAEIDEQIQLLNDAKQKLDKSIITVNQSVLDSLFNAAKTIYENAPEGIGHQQFTSQARELFFNSINNTETALSEPLTQNQVDSLFKTLYASIDSFNNSIITIDFSELTQIISSLQLIVDTVPIDNGLEHYQLTEVIHLENKIKNARLCIDLFGSTTQQIADTIHALNLALQHFESTKITLDISQLVALNDSAKTILSATTIGFGHKQCPDSTIKKSKNIVTSADKLLSSPTTQNDVDAMTQLLRSAVTEINANRIIVDFSQLDSLLNASQRLADTASVGIGNKQYPAETYQNFIQLINETRQYVDSTGITQNIVASKLQWLTLAKSIFETSQINIEIWDLQLKLQTANKLLSSSPAGNGHNQFPKEVIQLLDSLIKKTETLLKTTYTQLQIDSCTNTLDSAIQLVNQSVIVVDFTKITNEIEQCDTLIDTIRTGYGTGLFPKSALLSFKATIHSAKKHIDSVGITQFAVDQMTDSLIQARNRFLQSQNTVDLRLFNSAIENAQTFANQANTGNGHNQYNQQDIWELKESIKNAKSLLDTIYTQSQADSIAQIIHQITITIANRIINIDFSGLSALIEKSNTLVTNASIGNQPNQYPDSAAQIFKTAIAHAQSVVDSTGITTNELTEAIDSLSKAKIAFEKSINGMNYLSLYSKNFDAKDLLQNMNQGQGHNQYPEFEIETLQKTVDAAEQIVETSTSQESIDSITIALHKSIKDAQSSIITVDFSQLAALIDSAHVIAQKAPIGDEPMQYPQETLNRFTTIIAHAESYIDSTGITAEQARAMIDSLSDAKQIFISSQKAPLLDKLYLALQDANNFMDTALVGNGHKQYPSATIALLADSIADAEFTLKHPASQKEIDRSTEALINTINKTKDSLIIVDFYALNIIADQCDSLIKTAEIGNNANQYPDSAAIRFTKAIAHANSIIDSTGITKKITDETTAILQTEKELFEASRIIDISIAQNTITKAKDLFNATPIGNGHKQISEENSHLLQDSIAKAEMLIKTANNQSEVNTITAYLTQTISFIKNAIIIVDFSKLETVINTAETLANTATIGSGLGQYPQESFDAFTLAITNAKKYIDSVGITETTATTLTNSLEEAKKIFEASINEVSTQLLLAEIDSATKQLAVMEAGIGHMQYPQHSIDSLANVIATAAGIAKKTFTTQSSIDTAIALLKKTVHFTKKTQIRIDFSDLEKTLTHAKVKQDTMTTGNGHNQYPLEEKQKFENILLSVRLLINSKGITADKIENAIEQINSGLTQFAETRIVVDFTNLIAEIDTATAVIKNIKDENKIGNDIGQWPEDSVHTYSNYINSIQSMVYATGMSTSDVENELLALKKMSVWFKNQEIQTPHEKEALDKAIDSALAILNQAKNYQGSAFGNYPANYISVLESQIEFSKKQQQKDSVVRVIAILYQSLDSLDKLMLRNAADYLNSKLKNSPSTVCNNGVFTITVPQNSTPLKIQWYRNKSALTTDSLAAIIDKTGVYYAKIKSAHNTMTSDTLTVTVFTSLEKPTIKTKKETWLCTGEFKEIELTNPQEQHIKWIRNDTVISGETANIITIKKGGKYSTEISYNGQCPVASDTIEFIEYKAPEKPKISLNGFIGENCMSQDAAIQIDNYSKNNNYLVYIDGKKLPYDIPKQIKPIVANKTYEISAENENCSASINFLYEHTSASAAPTIQYIGPYWYLSSDITTSDNYMWFINGTLIENKNNYYYEAGNNLGTYQIAMKDENGCYVGSEPLIIPDDTEYHTHIDENKHNATFLLYPNITNNKIYISLKTNSASIALEILNSTGEKVMQWQYKTNSNPFSQTIDVSSLAKGQYIVSIFDGNTMFSEKIIIK